MSTPTQPIPNYITQEATNTISMPTHDTKTPLEHLCALVIHPLTGEYITNYKRLKKDTSTREVWTTSFGKEWVKLSQGDTKTVTKGTN